jgi:Tfp pilus assembly protein PilE
VTVIELMVVTLIVALTAVGLSAAISAALTLEQNYREESAVRTALALQMAYAERYFSLASGAASNITAGVLSYQTVYPMETGGVSFETSHWIRVTSCTLSETNGALNFRIESGDERWSSGTNQLYDKTFFADGLLRVAPARVIEARVEGVGDVRRLVLAADFPVQTREGVVTNEIEVSRPIRLWNRPTS